MTRSRHLIGAMGAIVLAIGGLPGCGSTGGPAGGEGSAGGSGATGGATPPALALAVIPKGSTDQHWAASASARRRPRPKPPLPGRRSASSGKGPIREDDREQQIQVVEGFISQGVQGIVLAPLDSRALRSVRSRKRRRPASHGDLRLDARGAARREVSYVSTDNGRGGRLAGRRMGELAEGQRAPC